MRRYGRLAVAPLLLALTACPAFDLVGLGPGVTLWFDVQPAGHGQWLEMPVIEVEEMAGGVRIETLTSTPDPCQAFDAAASKNGGELTLRVEVRRNAPGCRDVVGTFEYVAVLSDLPPGRYRLKIIHVFPETGEPAPRAVFDGEVEVR